MVNINQEKTNGMEEGNETNKHLTDMNVFNDDLDINMNDEDLFTFTQDDAITKYLFGKDSECCCLNGNKQLDQKLF